VTRLAYTLAVAWVVTAGLLYAWQLLGRAVG
jgi:hypothetical protein